MNIKLINGTINKLNSIDSIDECIKQSLTIGKVPKYALIKGAINLATFIGKILLSNFSILGVIKIRDKHAANER